MNKSPFPGMDPYLESLWPEVHARLIVYAANQLNSQLPDDLQADIEDNLAVYYNSVIKTVATTAWTTAANRMANSTTR